MRGIQVTAAALLLAVMLIGSVVAKDIRKTTNFKKVAQLNRGLDQLVGSHEALEARFKRLDERKASLRKAWLEKRRTISKRFSSKIKSLDLKKVQASALTALASVSIEISSQVLPGTSSQTPNQPHSPEKSDVGLIYDEIFKENTNLGQILNEIEGIERDINSETEGIKDLVNQIEGVKEVSISKQRLWDRKLEELDTLSKLVYEIPEDQVKLVNQFAEQELKYSDQLEKEIKQLANLTPQVAKRIESIDQDERKRKDNIRAYLEEDPILKAALNTPNNTVLNQTTSSNKSSSGFSLGGLFGSLFGSSNPKPAVENTNHSTSPLKTQTGFVPRDPSSQQASKAGVNHPTVIQGQNREPGKGSHQPEKHPVSIPNHPQTPPSQEGPSQHSRVQVGTPISADQGRASAHSSHPVPLAQSTTVILPPRVPGTAPPVVIIHNHQTTINVLPESASAHRPQQPPKAPAERVQKLQATVQTNKPQPMA